MAKTTQLITGLSRKAAGRGGCSKSQDTPGDVVSNYFVPFFALLWVFYGPSFEIVLSTSCGRFLRGIHKMGSLAALPRAVLCFHLRHCEFYLSTRKTLFLFSRVLFIGDLQIFNNLIYCSILNN